MASTISAGTTSGTAIAIAGDTSGALALQTNGTTTAVTINTSQQVGIGTTSPNNPLEVWTSGTGTTAGSNAAGRFSSSASGYDCNISFGDNVNSSARIGYLSGAQYFWTSGAERMRINSSGEVLVGTTTSSSPSTGIALIPSFSTTNASGISISHASNASSGNAYLFFLYNTSGIGSITQSGTTAVLYNTTSDYRLKENVTPIQNALDTVKALNPISFTWIDGRQDDGFLAHELQAVIPNCVTGEKDAVDENDKPIYQQMDNSGVIPFLVKAIQELNAKVDAQAATITELQAKVGA